MQSSQTKKSSYLLIAIGLALVVVIAVAVTLMARGRENTSREAQVAYGYMRSDLVGLIRTQAMTHRVTGRYAPDSDGAGQMQSMGVSKPVITLSGEGWFATVTSTTVPKIKCAVGVGAPNPLEQSAESGEIVCR